MSYTHKMAEAADIRYGKRMEHVDFGRRWIGFSDGSEATYERLVSTMLAAALIAASRRRARECPRRRVVLRCTNFLRVDVAAAHPTPP